MTEKQKTDVMSEEECKDFVTDILPELREKLSPVEAFIARAIFSSLVSDTPITIEDAWKVFDVMPPKDQAGIIGFWNYIMNNIMSAQQRALVEINRSKDGD